MRSITTRTLSTCVGDVGVERLRSRSRTRRAAPSCRRSPTTVQLLLAGLGEEHRHRVADLQVLALRRRRPAPRHVVRTERGDARRRCTSSSHVSARRASGRTPTTSTSPCRRPWRSTKRSGVTAPVSGSASIALRRRPGSARPCRTASSTIQSLFIALSTDVADRRLGRRREHGDERHQADADHQRRRRCRGATRVARRVLPGQRAGHARGARAAAQPTTVANGGRSPDRAPRRRRTRASAPRPTGAGAGAGQALGDERRAGDA